ALTGPIPGRTSSSSFVAVLMLIFSPALSFGMSLVVASAFLRGALLAVAVFAAAGAVTVTRSLRRSLRDLPTPLTLASSSTDFNGRAARIALACAGPIPGNSSSAAAAAVFKFTFSDLAVGSEVSADLALDLAAVDSATWT